MKVKPKLKWTLDVLMTAALLFLMGYQFWGEAAHEWIGAGLAVAAYGLVVFIKRDFLDYMLLKSEFVFMDYEESKFLFFMDYLALMGLCVFLSHYGTKLLKGAGRKRKKEVRL